MQSLRDALPWFLGVALLAVVLVGLGQKGKSASSPPHPASSASNSTTNSDPIPVTRYATREVVTVASLDQNAATLGVLRPGEAVQTFEERDGFFRISAPSSGEEGWVSAEALSVTLPGPEELPGGAWERSLSQSEMDDSKKVSFRLESSETLQGWLESYQPVLVARCQENKTEAYVITGMSMNPEYGRYNEHTVRLRFDDEKPRTEHWSESTDSKGLFAPAAIPLLRRIAKTKTLKMEVTPYNSSSGVVTFQVAGFDQHIGEIAQTCGWKL